MCGIVGYIGKYDTCKILLDGLKRVEYRGMIVLELLF